MAFSVNGIGTTYYGKSDEWPDGSYVKTLWLVFAFIPILPLRSIRVYEEAVESGSRTRYRAVSVRLHLRQVVSTYGVAIGALAVFIALINYIVDLRR